MNLKRFEGQVALVTGAASGIGRATWELVSNEGAKGVGVDLDADRLDRVAEAIQSTGGSGIPLKCNVLDDVQVGIAVRTVLEQFGRIDVLVNAVGGSTSIPNSARPTDELTLPEWRELIQLNLDGMFLFCRAVSPTMRSQGYGKIVNVSSIAGRGVAAASSSAYAAAKGAVIAFTKKLSNELGPSGINVNAIAPGLTLSERVAPIWESLSDTERQRRIDEIPNRRIATPVDQAKVIAFLASEDSNLVTGMTIDTAGGR